MAKRFISCKDFYVCGGKILMSLDGIEKIKETKIDADKFSKFFVHTKNKDIRQTEYEVWSKVIGFPEEKERTFDKKREMLKFNKSALDYLKKQLNHRGRVYSEYKINVFPTDDDCFGGVPCGEQMEQSNQYTSILEVIYKWCDLDENTKISNFLRLGLYLSIRNLNSGWLCACITPSQNKKLTRGVKVDSDLERIELEPVSKTVKVISPIPDIGSCSFTFTILEEGKSKRSPEEDGIHLIKVEVDLEQMEMIKTKIRSGIAKYSSESPEISRDSMQSMLSKHKW